MAGLPGAHIGGTRSDVTAVQIYDTKSIFSKVSYDSLLRMVNPRKANS